MFSSSLKKLLPQMLKDRLKRLFRYYRKFTSERWAEQRAVKIDGFCEEIDKALWSEAKKFSLSLERTGREKILRSDVRQGGAGALPLIYFIVRKIKPDIAIETGVASGWSSSSILTAISANSRGTLFSSDLPYPNIKGSDKVVGLIVDDKLKKNWNLYLGEDRVSLPKILSKVESVDFLHYDSNKTVVGRELVWKLVEPCLSQNALVIFDDIQDNYHFRDLMERLRCDFVVFEYSGKYLGMFCIGARLHEVLRANLSK